MDVLRSVTMAIGLMASVSAAHALPRVTYVSTAGSDDGYCGDTTPCRTITKAAEVLEPGGTVVVLTAGEYGAVNANKSFTVDAAGVAAVINTTGAGQGVVVPAGQTVTLRNISIEPGLGIHVGNGTLIAENVNIRGGGTGIMVIGANAVVTLRNVSMVGSSQNPGIIIQASGGLQTVTIENSQITRQHSGISVSGNSGTVKLSVRDTTISNVASKGINIAYLGANAQLSLTNTAISNAAGDGIYVSTFAGTTRLNIQDSKVTGSGGNGVLIAPTNAAKVYTTVTGSGLDGNLIGLRSFPASPAISTVSISDTSASNNVGGVHASGNSTIGIIGGNISGNSSYGVGAISPAAVRIGSSIVNGNTLGFSGSISSYGNNQLHGNTNPGSSSPLPPGSVP